MGIIYSKHLYKVIVTYVRAWLVRMYSNKEYGRTYYTKEIGGFIYHVEHNTVA